MQLYWWVPLTSFAKCPYLVQEFEYHFSLFCCARIGSLSTVPMHKLPITINEKIVFASKRYQYVWKRIPWISCPTHLDTNIWKEVTSPHLTKHLSLIHFPFLSTCNLIKCILGCTTICRWRLLARLLLTTQLFRSTFHDLTVIQKIYLI